MVWDEDELKDEDESNDGRTGGGKAKAGVDILLVQEVPKHEECQKEVHLCLSVYVEEGEYTN